jgi:hypothetical protein
MFCFLFFVKSQALVECSIHLREAVDASEALFPHLHALFARLVTLKHRKSEIFTDIADRSSLESSAELKSWLIHDTLNYESLLCSPPLELLKLSQEPVTYYPRWFDKVSCLLIERVLERSAFN